MNASSRLYTYLPKDNTALKDGILSTALSDKGFEKYRGRTGKYTKEDVLKVLDSWEPEWTRSKAISALTEPIPEDAAEDFLNFAKDRKLYSFSTKDLIKAKILAHLRRARKGGGTDPVDEVKKEKLNWHRKKKHYLFQGVPHYFVETTGGKIPPEFVREEKKASAKIDIPALYEEVRRAYSEMGYPVSGDRLSVSEQPTYTNGKPVPTDVLSSNESGGNTQADGTVRINPRYRAVMRHWGLKGPGRDFLRTIIGHELGHHIDKSVLSKPEHAEERKRLLREIVKAKFHTVYTDSYGPDTDPRKLDKELLAEYLASRVRRRLEKKAVSFSQDGSTFQLAAGETPGHAVKAWNSANPGRKVTTQQVLSANPKVKANGYRINRWYRTGLSAVAPIAKKPAVAPAPPRSPAPAPAMKTKAPAKPVAQRPEGTPIGYWNNNPGNLVSDGRTEWEGIRQILPKGKNMEFNDYGSGYRAMSRILYNYGAKHGIDTPSATVSRFAKSAPAAKKTEYANFLKSKTGWGPDDKIDLTKEETLQKLVPSMASFEIGPAWTAKHDPSVVSNAVTRAIPPK